MQPIHHAPGRHVAVNGTRLWVEREGQGEPLVLLVGGPAASHVTFHPVFSQLADAHEIVYYDYRGRGRSDAPADWHEITFDGDVEDLEGLRQALGFKTWSLYGFSYGGMVAQAYALKYPHAVKRLVLANTLHSPAMWQANHENINAELERQFPETWAQILALRAQGHTSSSPQMQALFAVHAPLIRWYDAGKAATLPREEGSMNRALYYVFAGDDIEFAIGGEVAKLPDFRPRLKELAMPVMILAGRYDRALYPQQQLEFKTYCPQARFVMLEKSGTFGHLEEPETVMPLLRAFLSGS
jgi:proline iminopeptidase